ncbi:MAG: hypothetical protein ACRCUE_10505 [Bosea sp. (in: a-proteobacteria)]
MSDARLTGPELVPMVIAGLSEVNHARGKMAGKSGVGVYGDCFDS